MHIFLVSKTFWPGFKFSGVRVENKMPFFGVMIFSEAKEQLEQKKPELQASSMYLVHLTSMVRAPFSLFGSHFNRPFFYISLRTGTGAGAGTTDC